MPIKELYLVEVWGYGRGPWGHSNKLPKPFLTLEDAIKAVLQKRSAGTLEWRYRVVWVKGSTRETLWVEAEGYREKVSSSNSDPPSSNEPQEDKGMPTITEPLNIPRDSLINRLQEVADEAKSKREAAQAAAEAARQGLLDAVKGLSADQIANVLYHYVSSSSNDTLTELVTEWVSEKKFVSKDIEPTFVETTLERSIRVLNLASDSTIKVQPNDEIYAYL